MRRDKVGRGVLAAALLCLALGAMSPACKKDQGSAKRALPKVSVPPAVLSWVGLRCPDRTVDGLLALIGRFVKLPLGRADLIDLLLQKAKLPRDLVAALDTSRTFWLVGLSQDKLAEPHPAVLALPIRSEKAFTAALGKRLELVGRKGELLTYRPKPGSVGLAEVRLAIHGGHAVVASSERAHAATRGFLLGNLLGSKPEHDVELHVWVKHLASAKGATQRVEAMLKRLRQRMQARGRPSEVIDAAQRSLRRYVELLASADDLMVAADVTAAGLTFTLRGSGAKSSRLARAAASQQAGAPFGLRLLPRDAWLVFADHARKAGSGEGGSLLTTAFANALKEAERRRDLDPAQRKRLTAALARLGAVLPGDVTVAGHRPPEGPGITISAVIGVKKSEDGRAIMAAAAEALGASFGASLAREAKRAGGAPARLEVEQRPLSVDGAEVGRIYAVTVPQSAAEQQRMRQLFGPRLTFGWAVIGSRALVSLGRAADKQLERMIAAAKADAPAGPSLADNPAFAAVAKPDRVGLVYLSLVDLARGLAAAGVEELTAFGADLEQARIKAAPALSWGFDRASNAVDLTLHLPISHFEHFKPFFKALSSRRGRPSLPRITP